MNYPSRTNICGSLPFAAELQSPLVPAPGLGADPRTALITPNPLYFPSQKALGAPYFGGLASHKLLKTAAGSDGVFPSLWGSPAAPRTLEHLMG